MVEKLVLYQNFMIYIFDPQLNFFLLLSPQNIEAHGTIIHIDKIIIILITYCKRNCCIFHEGAPVAILGSEMLCLEQARVQGEIQEIVV